MRYQTKGTCSSAIDIEVNNGVIESVAFIGGCNGNLKGISALGTGIKNTGLVFDIRAISQGCLQNA